MRRFLFRAGRLSANGSRTLPAKRGLFDRRLRLESLEGRLVLAAYDPAADINGDGRVSMKDAIAARNLLGESQDVSTAPSAAVMQIDPAIRAPALDKVLSHWPIVRAIRASRRRGSGRTTA